jgi:peptidoglycan biosynthesis protein MviN/MurJ (putative lipid II flippase)
LQITKKTKSIAWIVVVVSISGILMNMLLVPWLHNNGAALARLFASILFFGLVFIYSQKAYAIPYEMMKLFMMIIVGALLYLPVIWINDMGLQIRIISKTGLILVYPLLLYVLGFFEPVEIRSIHGAWMKWKNPSAWKNNIKNIKR